MYRQPSSSALESRCRTTSRVEARRTDPAGGGEAFSRQHSSITNYQPGPQHRGPQTCAGVAHFWGGSTRGFSWLRVMGWELTQLPNSRIGPGCWHHNENRILVTVRTAGRGYFGKAETFPKFAIKALFPPDSRSLPDGVFISSTRKPRRVCASALLIELCSRHCAGKPGCGNR